MRALGLAALRALADLARRGIVARGGDRDPRRQLRLHHAGRRRGPARAPGHQGRPRLRARAAASVIAKVARDALMTGLHDDLPPTTGRATRATRAPSTARRSARTASARITARRGRSPMRRRCSERACAIASGSRMDAPWMTKSSRTTTASSSWRSTGVPRRRLAVPVRDRDRATLLSRQRGQRRPPRHRARLLLRDLDDRRVGLGHLPGRSVREVRARADLQGRQRRGARSAATSSCRRSSRSTTERAPLLPSGTPPSGLSTDAVVRAAGWRAARRRRSRHGRQGRCSGARARTARRGICRRAGYEVLDRNWRCAAG